MEKPLSIINLTIMVGPKMCCLTFFSEYRTVVGLVWLVKPVEVCISLLYKTKINDSYVISHYQGRYPVIRIAHGARICLNAQTQSHHKTFAPFVSVTYILCTLQYILKYAHCLLQTSLFFANIFPYESQ